VVTDNKPFFASCCATAKTLTLIGLDMRVKNLKDIPGFEKLSEEERNRYWKEALKIFSKNHRIFMLVQFTLPFLAVAFVVLLRRLAPHVFGMHIPFLAALIWLLPQRFYFSRRMISGVSLIASKIASESVVQTD